MAGAPDPVIVLYDRDCGWCRWSIAKLLAADRRLLLLPEPIQSEAGAFLLAGVDPAERLASGHAVTPDGRRAPSISGPAYAPGRSDLA